MKNKPLASKEKIFAKGGAILAFVLAIGILLYFGFIKPTSFVIGGAIVSQPFYINAQKVSTTGINLEIINKGTEDFLVDRINIENCGNNDVEILIRKDSSLVENIPCSLNANQLFSGKITITYRRPSSSIDLYSEGKIKEKVAN